MSHAPHSQPPNTPYRSKPATTTPSSSSTSLSSSLASSTHPLHLPEHAEFAHASPTKALYASRLNHDISSIQAWLEPLFAPRAIPAPLLRWRDEVLAASPPDAHIGIAGVVELGGNEGNADGGKGNGVLEALKALKQANLLADHLRNLVHEARVEELSELERVEEVVERQREEGLPGRVCLDEVWAGLSREGRGALENLAEGAVVMGLNLGVGLQEGGVGDDVDGEGADDTDLMGVFANRILDRVHRNLMLEEQVRQLEMLQGVINAKSSKAQASSKNGSRSGQKLGATSGSSMHDVLDDESERHEAEQIHAQTARFNRDTKQINLKILEYQDRVNGMERQLAALREDSVSLEDVLEGRRRVEQRSNSVKGLEERVGAFVGLPPDLAASRDEVKRAMNELEALKRRREELFGRISSVER